MIPEKTTPALPVWPAMAISSHQLPLLLAGRGAVGVLACPTGGRVAAVFQQSIYLEDSQGRLTCIGGAAIGAGPLNALVTLPDDFPPWTELLRVGQQWQSSKGVVRIGPHLSLLLDGTELWRKAPPHSPLRLDLMARHFALLRKGVYRAVRKAVLSGAPLDGLGLLAGGHILPSVGHPSPKLGPLQQGLAERAKGPVAGLRRWLCAALAADDWDFRTGNHKPHPPREVVGLLGLGPGLTPAGDDLICGILLALHTFGKSAHAESLAGWALPLARKNSPPISVALLNAAASQGEGADFLHRILHGLGRDPGWTPGSHLAGVGFQHHTSGWDALAGIYLLVEALLEGRPVGQQFQVGD